MTTNYEWCAQCGRRVKHGSLLADGDESICPECWIERCSAREQQECIWIEDEWIGAWVTSCGELFIIIDGTPSQNHMLFCQHCGKRLVESPVEVTEVLL